MAQAHKLNWTGAAALAKGVREARARKAMTQAELARRAGVGLKFLYELENGKETLRMDKVFDVLEVLDLQLVVHPSRR